MKLLRRALALLLTGAMLLGSAGAATTSSSTYKDQKKITRTQAVSVMKLLGIMGGYANNSFNPTGQVTRAEMAKMLYVLCTGSTDASNYASVSLPYSDVSANWALNYIKYCYSLGILYGKTGTTFAPSESITAVETARMLLILDGYDSTRAGLAGSNWASKALSYGSQTGLFADVTISLTGALTREYAAQILENAIGIDAVKWSNDVGGFKSTGKTLGETCMKLDVKEGVLLGAMGVSISGSCTMVAARILEDDASSSTLITNMQRNYLHLLGKHVRTYARTSGVTYGMIADDYNAVDLEVKGSKVKSVDGENQITVDKKQYDVNTTDGITFVYVDATQDSSNKNVYNLSLTKTTVDTSPLELAAAISAGGSDTAHVISSDGDYIIDTVVYYSKNVVKYCFAK